MQDLKLEAPATEEVQVEARTLEAIDRGTQAADEGRTVSIEEARWTDPRVSLISGILRMTDRSH